MMRWQIDVNPQKARARCAECGSSDLVAVCHECGAGLCQEHLIRLEEQPWYRSFPEFKGLNLERTEMGDVGIHCSVCFHYIYTLDLLIWVGVLLAFAAFFFSLFLTWRNLGASLWGWFAVIIGLLMVFTGLLFSIVHTERQRARKVPDLPVLGRFPTVKVRETVAGRILLDAGGTYSGEVERAGGVYTYSLRFTALDQARKQLYQQKYGRRTPADLPFNAGFLVGKGDARLDYQGQAVRQQRQSNTIELSAPLSENRFLSGLRPAGAGPTADPRWSASYRYVFQPGEHLPVQIIPALLADGEEVGLELFVQIIPWPKLDLQDVILRIERFKLCAPDDLGRPLAWSPSAQFEPGDDLCEDAAFQSLVWKGVPFSTGSDDDGASAELEPAHPYARFYVRFENYLLLKHRPLRGQLQVRLENKLLSGLEGVDLYYPLGHLREDGTISWATEISVGFSLNLGQLQFHGMRSLSQRVQAAEIPDHEFIVSLAERLEARGIYVKRVAENPPQTSRASARVVGHAWQIDGRSYQGLYPFDFQLVITGLEIYEDEPWPVRGEANIDLRVTADVRTRQMYEQLQQLLEEVGRILRQLPGGDSRSDRTSSADDGLLPARPRARGKSSQRPPRPWLNN